MKSGLYRIESSLELDTLAESGDVMITGSGGIVFGKIRPVRIKAIPKAETVEVMHGEWVYEPVEFTYEKDIKCSVCGGYVNYVSKYCPNCGAKMDGGKVNEH